MACAINVWPLAGLLRSQRAVGPPIERPALYRQLGRPAGRPSCLRPRRGRSAAAPGSSPRLAVSALGPCGPAGSACARVRRGFVVCGPALLRAALRGWLPALPSPAREARPGGGPLGRLRGGGLRPLVGLAPGSARFPWRLRVPPASSRPGRTGGSGFAVAASVALCAPAVLVSWPLRRPLFRCGGFNRRRAPILFSPPPVLPFGEEAALKGEDFA